MLPRVTTVALARRLQTWTSDAFSQLDCKNEELHLREFIDFRDVPQALGDFFRWYEFNKGKIEPVALAALSYRWLVSIHPFSNGNGRTARLVQDWILQENGYPPAAIQSDRASVASFGRSSDQAETEFHGHERVIYFTLDGMLRTVLTAHDLQSR